MPADPQRVRDLFLAAAELPAPNRAAYLSANAGDDAELRAAVERLLAAHEQPAPVLLRPAPGVPTADFAPIAETVGTKIGHYKLMEQIGEGGFGLVFVAEQTEPVRRKVALKVIKPGMDSSQVIARFQAERQALAMMDHPNIARVLDAGATDSGRPYFVMELVRGIPITAYCDQNHLPPRERLELFVSVCHAIQHAHQKGVIHRDIKPSNVLVTSHDGKPVAKVIDFGVAKAIHQPLTERTIYTNFAQMIGTPLYMSPEQAEMSGLDIDTRSDIYSLGVLLYELLTGSTPLAKKRVAAAAYDEIRRLIREDEPPRPSTRLSTSDSLAAIAAQRHTEPAKLSKLVRGDLDWITMKALEKDRTRRYETANGMARDIQRYLADEVVEARPPSTAYRLRKFARKYRAALTTAVALVLLLVAGITASTVLAVRAHRAEAAARDAQQAESERAEGERRANAGLASTNAELAAEQAKVAAERNTARTAAEQAQAVNAFLTEDLLGQADPDVNDREKKVTVEELLHKAARNIEENAKFADQPATEAMLRLTIGKTFYKLGALPEAEKHLKRAVELRRQALGPDDLHTLAAQEALADFLNLGPGRCAEAEPLARQTWQARARVLGPEHCTTLDSLDTYVTALGGLQRTAEAIARCRECLTARRRVLGANHRDTLISMNNLAVRLAENGEWPEAIVLHRETLDVGTQKQGTEYAKWVRNLAQALYLNGNLAEAELLLQENLDRSTKQLGPDHPVTERLRDMLISVWIDQGRVEPAVALGREVVNLRRRIYGKEHFKTGNALGELGRGLVLLGRHAEAEAALGESLRILAKGTRYSGYYAAWAECWYGASLTGLGRYPEAASRLLSAEARLREASMTPRRHYRQALEQLVTLYEKWGRPEQAAPWRKKIEVEKSGE